MTRLKNKGRVIAVPTAFVVAATVAAAVTAGAVSATADDLSPEQRSATLTTRADLNQSDTSRVARSEAAAREAATGLAAGIPLPEGGNFNGIQWEHAVGWPHDALQSVLEYNAMCQWVRALADGRQVEDAKRVLADVPSWPTFRTPENHAAVQNLVPGSVTFDARVLECRLSSKLERDYATAKRLTPSS